MSRDVKRSKSLRTWNKYKKLVYVLLVVLVIIVALVVLIAKTINSSKSKPTETAPIETETHFETETEPETTEQETTEPESTEPETTEPETTLATEIVKTPEKEDLAYESFYDDAVLLGDVFVSGISTYSKLSSKKLVFGETWTIGKASDSVSKLKETNANKVFIELGLNDLNNGRSATKAYELYEELVNDIKKALPNAQIYVVSLFPVTTGFEGKSTTTIKNSTVSELNGMLSGMDGVTFLNVNNSISNSDGSLNADLSDSGYNIKPSYYGFILNLMAEMCQ